MKLFISYCHQQRDWVKKYLVPCLRAGGAEALIDYRQFQGGRNLIGQMDATQDQADINVLVITPAYLESKVCKHEMDRVIKCDPDFSNGMRYASYSTEMYLLTLSLGGKESGGANY